MNYGLRIPCCLIFFLIGTYSYHTSLMWHVWPCGARGMGVRPTVTSSRQGTPTRALDLLDEALRHPVHSREGNEASCGLPSPRLQNTQNGPQWACECLLDDYVQIARIVPFHLLYVEIPMIFFFHSKLYFIYICRLKCTKSMSKLSIVTRAIASGRTNPSRYHRISDRSG